MWGDEQPPLENFTEEESVKTRKQKALKKDEGPERCLPHPKGIVWEAMLSVKLSPSQMAASFQEKIATNM